MAQEVADLLTNSYAFKLKERQRFQKQLQSKEKELSRVKSAGDTQKSRKVELLKKIQESDHQIKQMQLENEERKQLVHQQEL